MPRKGYKPEAIIRKLREAEVRSGQGPSVDEGCPKVCPESC